MLLACMIAIGRLKSAPSLKLSVLVCNNNAEPLEKGYVSALEEAVGVQFFLVNEPEPGIPFARNTAIEAAVALKPEWIGFIDDDEQVDENWLLEIERAMKTWPADVFHGWTQSTPEPGANLDWYFNKPRNKRVGGTEMSSAGTDNVVIKAQLVDGTKEKYRFNQTMRFSGGTDLELFYRVTDAGYRIVWVPDAITKETIPAERLTLRYQIKRAKAVAAVHGYISRSRKGMAVAVIQILPKAAGRLVQAFGLLFVALGAWAVQNKGWRKVLLKASKKLAYVVGTIAGLAQSLPSVYQKIHGR